jgi:hypothetical protein
MAGELLQILEGMSASAKWADVRVKSTDKLPRKGYRRIVRHECRSDVMGSVTSRSMSFRSVQEHRLHLECGHVVKRRGDSVPEFHVLCKECDA